MSPDCSGLTTVGSFPVSWYTPSSTKEARSVSTGVGKPKSSISVIKGVQNSSHIILHVPKCSWLSGTVHARQELSSMSVRCPTVYKLRCMSRSHVNWSRGVA